MSFAELPKDEIEVFKQLPDLKIIFDIGSRDNLEYLDICPNAEYHLFEPNPVFFQNLREEIKNRKIENKVYLNNCGVGNENKMEKYADGWQAFLGGENRNITATDKELPMITLENYITQNSIKKIDFLKIDTEGYDYKVLVGGKSALPITRFLQYEHWNDKVEFHALLGETFDMEYIGGRNVLCMNKQLVSLATRNELRIFLEEHKTKHGYTT